jgi:hypothetical protein
VAAQLLERTLRASTGSEALVKFTLDQNDTLGKMDQALRKLGAILHPDLTKNVVQPRNKAIHEGLQPAPGEALAAYETATAIANAHSPLPR